MTPTWIKEQEELEVRQSRSISYVPADHLCNSSVSSPLLRLWSVGRWSHWRQIWGFFSFPNILKPPLRKRNARYLLPGYSLSSRTNDWTMVYSTHHWRHGQDHSVLYGRVMPNEIMSSTLCKYLCRQVRKRKMKHMSFVHVCSLPHKKKMFFI